jgi:hypothetical protein
MVAKRWVDGHLARIPVLSRKVSTAGRNASRRSDTQNSLRPGREWFAFDLPGCLRACLRFGLRFGLRGCLRDISPYLVGFIWLA